MKSLTSFLFHDLYEHDPVESGSNMPLARRFRVPVPAFERQLHRISMERGAVPVLVNRPPMIDKRMTPFTVSIDDASLSYHALAAGRLERLGWRGHCFVTAARVGCRGYMQAYQIREIHARGHLIGSHSCANPVLSNTLSWPTLLEQWQRSKATLEDITGTEVVTASMPWGYYSNRIVRAAGAAGFKFLFTSEPQPQLRLIGGCWLIGRYTISRSSPVDFAVRLLRGDTALALRESLTWNSRKNRADSVHAGYQSLTDWTVAARQ